MKEKIVELKGKVFGVIMDVIGYLFGMIVFF